MIVRDLSFRGRIPSHFFTVSRTSDILNLDFFFHGAERRPACLMCDNVYTHLCHYRRLSSSQNMATTSAIPVAMNITSQNT
jgi:hypothetical protein